MLLYLLWLFDDLKAADLLSELNKAIARYARKFNAPPTVIYVNPTDLSTPDHADQLSQSLGLKIIPGAIPAKHLLVGKEA